MINNKFVLLLLVILFPTLGWGATLYMGSGETYTNLQAAMAAMSAGDTLIIRDGTYTGSTNKITNDYYPPTSSTVWTTIKAEHDGAVTFDAGGGGTMFFCYLGTSTTTRVNWQFEGIVWGNSNESAVDFQALSYIKFLRCGGFDAGDSGGIFFASRSSYVLFDGCYAWGRGRSGFTAWTSDYHNDHIIIRNCVSRIDRASATTEPLYNFGLYSTEHGLIQNSIAIDSDQLTSYNTGSIRSGGFAVPSTDHDASDNKIYNSIVLNSKIGGLFTTKNTYSAYDSQFYNSVVAGVKNGLTYDLNSFRGDRTVIDHVTFVNGTSNDATDTNGLYAWPWTGSPNGGMNMTNSIVTGYTGPFTAGLSYGMAGDYQAFYNNASPISIDSTPIGTHSKTTVNPIWNASTNPTGALKYITRIEPGSNLSGQGSSGDIGANLITLRGTTGALWGETGYDTDTGISMWPYPNEALIKSKMSTYTGGGVNGARGFCSSGTQLNGTDTITLTSYIWEYLGNQMPTDIYGAGDGTPVSRGTVMFGFSLN